MSFTANSVYCFMEEFSAAETVNGFFSFFGFYGVYVFIFLSGYGLTKAFAPLNTGGGISFIIKHIAKIYKLFLISVFVYVLYKFPNINTTALFYTLSLTNNFFPERLFLVNGPWWFFSLIIQLYLTFLPLYYLLKKDKANLIYIFYFYLICAGFLIYTDGQVIEFYANFAGHLPEFSLGIYIALYEKELPFLHSRLKNIYLAAGSLVIIIGAQFFKLFFILGFAASSIFALSFFFALNWRENKFLQYTGRISPYLFGFNGFLFRHYWTITAEETNNAFLKLCCCGVWLAINYAAAAAACRLFNKRATSTTSKV